MIQVRCRHFNGYKPCGKNDHCSFECGHRDIVESSILIVHLGALGAVIRATSLLDAIRKKHPKSLITWVTDKPADQLLKNHPKIDRVLTTSAEDILQLQALQFDTAYVVDKSLKAAGVLANTTAKSIFGFKIDPVKGSILPATKAAEELWGLGLSNHQKFFVNKKSEVQLMLEALELSTGVEADYDLPLSEKEEKASLHRANIWALDPEQAIIGINTGCAAVIPYKKLSIENHRELIQKLLDQGLTNLVLLGGPEDTERNRKIGEGLPVIQSDTTMGLRDGLVSVAACDLVITGDSLGMHMAISQKKYVTAWFGPTCAQEIALYGRGDAVITKATCAPCWKRSCDLQSMCYDQVDLKEMISSVLKGMAIWQKVKSSSSRQLFSETSSSVSR